MAYDTSYYDKQIKEYNAYADNLAKQQIAQAQQTAQTAEIISKIPTTAATA